MLVLKIWLNMFLIPIKYGLKFEI